eukprot:11239870-Alexandrium_andersonii.AAC.1
MCPHLRTREKTSEPLDGRPTLDDPLSEGRERSGGALPSWRTHHQDAAMKDPGVDHAHLALGRQ